VFIICCLINSCFSFADPLTDNSLKVAGRALANYQVCEQLAADINDKAMVSYYSQMFADSSAKINRFTEKQSEFVIQEFKRSVNKLLKINTRVMTQLCLRRFDPLTRKMQEKKLAILNLVN
jgi:hypothetical protein